MCISRIDALEQRLEDTLKTILINDIASFTSRDKTYLRVFSFLMGMSKEERADIHTRKELVSYFCSKKKSTSLSVPDRVTELHRHVKRHPPVWEWETYDTDCPPAWKSDIGIGMYTVLSDMTISELRRYVEWNLAITGWTVK